jgi:C4-dicarboxylate-specific signal transduction histidine kinase
VGLHVAKATRKDEEIVEIRVVDHGPGLDPSVADNLFDPFVTTKTSVGRGMGLTVVRHGLKSLGAEASLEKSDSSGTTFLIRYPLRS